MNKIQIHILNTATVVFFSFIAALCINEIITIVIKPTDHKNIMQSRFTPTAASLKSFSEYQSMLNSNFFRVAAVDDSGGPAQSSEINELIVLGTVSGPPSIARALIRKQNETEPQVYKVGSDVHGFRLIRIDNAKIYLRKDGKVEIIDMFALPRPTDSGSAQQTAQQAAPNRIVRSISKAEIQQKVLNNLDNALNGVRAGPFRVGGKIHGFKLFSVAPFNILYSMGARSGDVVKRINGQSIDSTEKLMRMWETLKTDTRFVIELERSGQALTFDLSVAD